MNRGLFFTLLREHSGGQGYKMVLAAITSGFLQGLAIMAVGMALDNVKSGDIPLRVFLIFILSIGAYFICYRYAVGRSTAVALNMVATLQVQLTDALKNLQLREFEQLDQGQVYQEIIGNKDIIVEATRYVLLAVIGSSLMVAAFLFSIYISVPGFLVIVIALAFSTLFLAFVQSDVMQLQRRAQKLDDLFVRSLKDLIFGFVELKMSRKKQDDLFKNVINTRATECKDIKLEAEQVHVKGLAFFTSFVFFPVGAIVFILPGFVELPFEDTVKLIGITLFSLGPLSSIVMALPVLTKAEMLLGGLSSFHDMLKSCSEGENHDHDLAPFDFEQIELRDCKFRYASDNGLLQFSLEIEQFHLRKNEIVFITGGNGSGKTSLIKILAGLYSPQSGQILIDNRSVSDIGMVNYRNLFAIVLLNFHLFERLYGIGEVDEAYCQKLLCEMMLDKRLWLKEGCRFSSTELSSGQRKRLAVVAACLEKKEILLFDEVAADFDPVFRKFFYEEFLPQLRSEGKTIIAISHDDRYYNVADRVVSMRYGKIESETSNT